MITAAPINMNLLKMFQWHFNFSAVHSDFEKTTLSHKSQILLVFWTETFSDTYIENIKYDFYLKESKGGACKNVCGEHVKTWRVQ